MTTTRKSNATAIIMGKRKDYLMTNAVCVSVFGHSLCEHQKRKQIN